MLGDDEEAWSYHGYACSDYYHIDPRYGSNSQYALMVKQAHEKGLKILMDMVPITVSNHSEKGRNGQNLTSVELRTIFCG